MPDGFCTYFDSRYLTRGLALWASLRQHAGECELFVLCMDDAALDALRRLSLPGLIPIPLRDLEEDDPELAAAKTTRSPIEYYFTTTPALPLHILRRAPQLESITYLDADLWFFGGIDALRQELGGGSIGIIAHRFPPRIAHMSRWGIYNVGLVMFRNDARGRAVLEWWRARCIEWCYDRIEANRFADQKYLDRWPSQFEGVVVIAHKGANVAPWNAENHELRDGGGRILVDDAPLLFYHFHGLRRWSASLWQLGFVRYGARPPRVLIDRVYLPYIAALQRWDARLEHMTTLPPLRYRPRLLDVVRFPLHLATRELIVV
ncbi:MAG TPA: hypothetical protein VNA69_01225 [Thermoanaerobaculia bacterium]|nr:hypothetical protein [Thermoanaerobaculia bacterium]